MGLKQGLKSSMETMTLKKPLTKGGLKAFDT